MFAAFIILLPAGILAANLFSRTHARQSWWFYAHAVLTGLGSLLGVAGLGIGLVLMVPTYYAMIHRWIGISIIIAIVIQVRHSGNPQGVLDVFGLCHIPAYALRLRAILLQLCTAGSCLPVAMHRCIFA